VPSEIPLLRILPSGPALPLNPAESLAWLRLELILKVLRGMADVVILDSPPVRPVADTTILATKGVAVILVIQAAKTRLQAVRLAQQSLRHAQARLLGVVLNRAPRQATGYYAYRYPEETASSTQSPSRANRPTGS